MSLNRVSDGDRAMLLSSLSVVTAREMHVTASMLLLEQALRS